MSTATKQERLNEWTRKWELQDIKFHKLEPNDGLTTFIDKLTLGRNNLTFLVPLCGKSLDMIWLYQNGHTVIGIELVESAITTFFEENKLSCTKTDVHNGVVYQSPDKRIRIFQGDLFGFNAEILGKVDGVWDRGSLVAVYKDERIKYVDLMKSLLKPGFRYLLQTFDYDDRRTSSSVTPRSVTENEVRSLFSDFSIEKLRAIDKTDIKKSGAIILADVITQCDYIITDNESL